MPAMPGPLLMVGIGSRIGPIDYVLSGGAVAGTSVEVRFTGGIGLNLASGNGDSAKIVVSGGSCDSIAAGGTAIASNLGPDDSTSATSATASFLFTSSGDYVVCYKLCNISNQFTSVGFPFTVGPNSTFHGPASYTLDISLLTTISPIVLLTFQGRVELTLGSP